MKAIYIRTSTAEQFPEKQITIKLNQAYSYTRHKKLNYKTTNQNETRNKKRNNKKVWETLVVWNSNQTCKME